MHFQGPCSREALAALWKGADAGCLVCIGVTLLHDGLRLTLSPAAVVHQMGLEVPLAPEPDPTSFARKDVLWWGRGGRGRGGQRRHHIRIYEALSYLCPSTEIKSLHICTCTLSQSRISKRALKGFSAKSSAAAYRCVATTGLVPFLKGKQEHWTICLQKPPCRAEPR